MSRVPRGALKENIFVPGKFRANLRATTVTGNRPQKLHHRKVPRSSAPEPVLDAEGQKLEKNGGGVSRR